MSLRWGVENYQSLREIKCHFCDKTLSVFFMYDEPSDNISVPWICCHNCVNTARKLMLENEINESKKWLEWRTKIGEGSLEWRSSYADYIKKLEVLYATIT